MMTQQTQTQTGDPSTNSGCDLTTQFLESIAAKLSGHTTAPIYADDVRDALARALAETVGEAGELGLLEEGGQGSGIGGRE